MKKILIYTLTIILFVGCGDLDIVDNNYTPSVIYMSQAATAVHRTGGIYTLTSNQYGQTVNFTIQGDQVVIPVGLIRSGVDLSGDIQVNVHVDNDTVAILKNNDILESNVLELSTNQFSVPSSVTFPGGSTNQKFDMNISLNYLIGMLQSNDSTSLAVGVSISTPDHRENKDLATTVFLLNPSDLLVPVADFSSYTYNDGSRTGFFINLSKNSKSYHWDFGDGSTSSEPVPTHKYASPGTYTISLTVKGESDQLPDSVKTQTLEIK